MSRSKLRRSDLPDVTRANDVTMRLGAYVRTIARVFGCPEAPAMWWEAEPSDGEKDHADQNGIHAMAVKKRSIEGGVNCVSKKSQQCAGARSC